MIIITQLLLLIAVNSLLCGMSNPTNVFTVKEVDCDKINTDISVMVPTNLNIPQGTEQELKLGKEILKFYTNSETLSWHQVPGYIDFISDIGFVLGYECSRNFLLKYNTEAVFTYLFSYTSPRGFSTFLIPLGYPENAASFVGSGASHGDELALLFKTNMPQVPFIPPNPEDQAFMNKFLKAWTLFAKTGNPNCGEIDVTWKPDSVENPHYLNIGKDWKLVDNTIFPERMKFWREIYEKYLYSC